MSPRSFSDPRSFPARFAPLSYLLLAGATVALALALASCGDPVHDDAIAALGPEAPNVPPGPLHRPGQPCAACHRDGGPAVPFSLAGTVYATATSPKPAANVTVMIFDATLALTTFTTNCAGNFFARASDYAPKFPIWATLRAGRIQRDMDSPAYREGSCAACHTASVGPASAGPVYLIDDPGTQSLPPGQCN